MSGKNPVFECPACNHQGAIHPRLLGRTINCPNCQAPLLLPTLEELEQDRQLVDQLQRLQPDQRDRQRRRASAERERVHHPQAEDVVMVQRSESTAAGLAAAGGTGSAAVQPLVAGGLTASLSPRSNQDEMDMTPMVDVTFLLLIFFMITASFSLQKSIQVPAQRAEESAAADPLETGDVVRIIVDAFNVYLVQLPDGQELEATSRQDLRQQLTAAAEVGTEPRLQIQAHEEALHAAVVAALDVGRDKGYVNFQVGIFDDPAGE
jgi:biopolymer transport protein ExbD